MCTHAICRRTFASYSTGQYIWCYISAPPEQQNHLLLVLASIISFPEEFAGVLESFRVMPSLEPRTKTRTIGVEVQGRELGDPLWKQNFKLWSSIANGGSDIALMHAETINIPWQEWRNMDHSCMGTGFVWHKLGGKEARYCKSLFYSVVNYRVSSGFRVIHWDHTPKL